MSKTLETIAPLREFVVAMTELVQSTDDEASLLAVANKHLTRLITNDTWLPDSCAVARPDTYAQYLLHCDPLERFSVVSFVWGPGHRTPVHDHTVWGLVGQMRGAELCEEYGLENGLPVPSGQCHTMRPGQVDAVSPTIGDWHRVSNAREDGPSISIHVYGANIGAVRRHRLDDHGQIIDFVSGYSSATVPNLWDRSAQMRTAP